MKLYIWTDIDNISENYHNSGGVVIIADSLKRAKILLPFYGKGKREKDQPDHSYELVKECKEKVIVFPDAGCC